MIGLFDTETLVSVKKLHRVSWFTYFCGLSADLLMISVGMNISWFSPVVTKLLSTDPDVNPLEKPISVLQVSILSVIPLFAAIATFSPWAKILNTFGIKKTMRIISTIHICSLIAIAFGNNIIFYYSFLPFIGVTNSGIMLATSIYNTEIAQDCNRGTLNCIMSMHIPIGILIGYVIGSVASVKYFCLICTIPSILFYLLSFFLPESPYFLLSKEKCIEGFEVLKALRGDENISEVEHECKTIIATINKTLTSKPRTILQLVKCRMVRKAFFLSIQLFITEQFSGISIILAYVSIIFDKADCGISGDNVGILVGSVKLISFFPAIYYVDKLGRRPLIFISTSGCSCLMLLLGIFFYLDSISSNVIDKTRWLPVFLILIFIFSYGIGLGNVPMAFAGEIFPKDARAAGIALSLMISTLVMVMILFCFPFISKHCGLHWCFWICAAASAIGCISLLFTMPETKGKSFIKIQQLLLK